MIYCLNSYFDLIFLRISFYLTQTHHLNTIIYTIIINITLFFVTNSSPLGLSLSRFSTFYIYPAVFGKFPTHVEQHFQLSNLQRFFMSFPPLAHSEPDERQESLIAAFCILIYEPSSQFLQQKLLFSKYMFLLKSTLQAACFCFVIPAGCSLPPPDLT